MHVKRLLGLSLIAAAASSLAAAPPPSFAEMRASRIRTHKAELRRHGFTAEDAEAAAQRADEAAMALGGSEADWAWAFEAVTRDGLRLLRAQADAARARAVDAYLQGRSSEIAIYDDPDRRPGTQPSRIVDAPTPALTLYNVDGQVVGVNLARLPDPSRATSTAIAAAAEPPGALVEGPPGSGSIGLRMTEVNRQRRAAGLLGSRRQRQAAKARGLKP